jgi:23S rRNA pseudouridine2605 synthase
MEGLRLNRYLAQAGVASRRSADALIAAGRVAIDGEPVSDLGRRVEAGQRVTLDGKPVGKAERLFHVLLHKPAGVVTTLSDPQGRRTVADLVDVPVRVYPVGRLDAETTGLLVLTNEGDLAHRLSHPSSGVEKTYHARVRGRPDEAALQRLRDGVELEDGRTAPARVRLLRGDDRVSNVEVVIHEGKNHQVRRMLDAVGHRCFALHRPRYGPLQLGDLPAGRSRPLRPAEVRDLRRAAGLR